MPCYLSTDRDVPGINAQDHWRKQLMGASMVLVDLDVRNQTFHTRPASQSEQVFL
jgi:hypothetical protein